MEEPITTTGAYTTTVVANWPADVTLEDAHLFLEFVNITGTVAAEVPVTVTIEPGPTVAPIQWSTGTFSPTFAPDEDYIVMVFWTDWQGNIIDTAARPLSSFRADMRPDSTLNFGFGTDLIVTYSKQSLTVLYGSIVRSVSTLGNSNFLSVPYSTYSLLPPTIA